MEYQKNVLKTGKSHPNGRVGKAEEFYFWYPVKSEAPIAEKAITEFIETNKKWVLFAANSRIKRYRKLEFQKEEFRRSFERQAKKI